eukprot:COSAG04_NODE_596_length_12255_cov_4.614018_2_plen_112_part_00
MCPTSVPLRVATFHLIVRTTCLEAGLCTKPTAAARRPRPRVRRQDQSPAPRVPAWERRAGCCGELNDPRDASQLRVRGGCNAVGIGESNAAQREKSLAKQETVVFTGVEKW